MPQIHPTIPKIADIITVTPQCSAVTWKNNIFLFILFLTIYFSYPQGAEAEPTSRENFPYMQ
jgi:hypothetical protein